MPNLPTVVGRGTLAARPAAGTAGRLYYVTDDSTLYRDNGSAWESVGEAAGGGGGSITVKRVRKTSANYSLTSTTWAAMDATTDVTIAAAVGDLIAYSLTGKWNNDAGQGRIDVATVVGGSVVSYFGDASGTNVGDGVVAWFTPGGVFTSVTGEVNHVLVAGDIDAGNVTLSLRYRVGATKAFMAGSTAPLFIRVTNYGPPA